MSKIGRKPIDISGVTVDVKGQEVHYKGAKASGVHELDAMLSVQVQDGMLRITTSEDAAQARKRDVNRVWGLHRALLANKISGARQEFERKLEITGLGYKAVLSGSKLVFTLGYSHKIDFDLPKNISVDIDKSGQKLTVKSFDKTVVGKVCSDIKSLRRSEPYKGTGIKLDTDIIIRKAGKTKSA